MDAALIDTDPLVDLTNFNENTLELDTFLSLMQLEEDIASQSRSPTRKGTDLLKSDTQNAPILSDLAELRMLDNPAMPPGPRGFAYEDTSNDNTAVSKPDLPMIIGPINHVAITSQSTIGSTNGQGSEATKGPHTKVCRASVLITRCRNQNLYNSQDKAHGSDLGGSFDVLKENISLSVSKSLNSPSSDHVQQQSKYDVLRNLSATSSLPLATSAQTSRHRQDDLKSFSVSTFPAGKKESSSYSPASFSAFSPKSPNSRTTAEVIADLKQGGRKPVHSTATRRQASPAQKMAPSDLQVKGDGPRTVEEVMADLTRPARTSVSSASTGRQGSSTDTEIMPQTGEQITASNSLGEDDPAEDDDNESETDEEREKKPRKISERRRGQIAIAQAYFNKIARQDGFLAPKVLPEDEDKQSLKWLIKQSESYKVISSPRDYQIELYERAKERNIIAVLDTGSGKTMIAVMLLRHILGQELEERALGKPRRIAFFLVDSVQLVFQQAGVLEANLDQKIEKFCGDMGCDLWDRRHWEKHFSENNVIVCTAEVLYQCLHHSFISMERINLLIFDEAHHAKKNHSYARIIKDFYSQIDPRFPKPKIFGMTASPVDARVDVRRAAAELEALLHSEIATAADASLLQYSMNKSAEHLAPYSVLRPCFETPLYKEMKSRFKENGVLRKPMIYAYEATRELGSWCADQVWAFSLTEEQELIKLMAKTESQYRGTRATAPLEVLEARKSQLDEAHAIVKSYDFEAPEYYVGADGTNPTSKNLSSKVLFLVKYLRERFERPTEDKCIVFVTQRYTARLLARLLAQENIGTPHLRVGTLVGTRTGDAGDLNISFKQQVITMREFRQGRLNCLFATSVAEEGLDIPDCNLVIRFDLYTTLIQYIQSRGRARHANSKYIHMYEAGNPQHIEIIREVRKNENILKRFCNELPEDRKLTGNDYNMDYFLSKEKTHRVYKVPETGAKLTYRMSLMVLANFVDSLPHSLESNPTPDFVITSQNKQYICEVILPETSPVRGAIGRPASTKQVAKCSAAFEMCLALRKGKYLDEWLLPIFTKQLPAMRNAALAVDSKKREAYDMRTKPSLWSAGGVPDELYLTVFLLEKPECLDRPSQPLGILTRTKLPHLPKFPLFFGGGLNSLVEFIVMDNPLRLTDASLLSEITGFNIRFFWDIFSKLYEPDEANMPYFIVPIKSSFDIHSHSDPSDLISWDVVSQCANIERLQCDENTPESFYSNRFLADPHDGSRKFWSVGVTHEYKPLDPVPPNTAPRPGTRRDNSNIMEYSISLWQRARKNAVFKEIQPVVEAELISLRRNNLDEFDIQEDETPKKCYLIMEPLRISPIPTDVVAMGYLFPAIIHRVESYLISLDACSMLNLEIRPDLALEAMTKDSDNTDEHGEQQVNFKGGMGNNYERLEFLGDCFLKMAISISLYGMHPNSDEYQYHVDRMMLICNKNLKQNAVKLKLFEYIRFQNFNRRVWYPEGLVLIKGKRATAPKSHKLGDKTIADVCEALIGAAYLSYLESNNMDMAVRAVTVLVNSENHKLDSYADYYRQYTKPKFQTEPATEQQKDRAKQAEAKHSYHFKYPRLLSSAFSHPSYPTVYEKIPHYERLEFLGDSLLDMVCVNYLFHKYPTRDPQWLTEHKMAMVSNQFLGALCVLLGFNKHLLIFNASFAKQIQDYVSEITECRLQAEQEAIQNGKTARDCARDYWVQTKQPPKCLPDLVEAYIGAVFVDSEYNYSEVERFFDEHIKWFFEDMRIYDTYANKHPTTFLSNFLSINMGCSNWRLLSQPQSAIDGNKPKVFACLIVHDQVISHATLESSRYAKVKASKKAMEILDGLSPKEFREKYGCQCKLNAEGEMIEEVIIDEEETHGTAV